MCNIEFPHFGASYPDAHCIDGYLWDMDSYENGCYTIGGDDPCPFCNTEAWLKTVLDNEEFASCEEALAWVEKMREKWGAEHRGGSEIPKDLEEAAEEYSKKVSDGHNYRDLRVGFIAGYKYHAEHAPLPEDTVTYNKGVAEGKRLMMEEAVEGEVYKFGEVAYVKEHNNTELTKYLSRFNNGDKVKIIVIHETDI